MSRYTPGPWTYTKHGWQNSSVYAEGSDQLICTLSMYEEDVTEDNQDELEAQQEANARLIAAAPDVLEALIHEHSVNQENVTVHAHCEAGLCVTCAAIKLAGGNA